MNSKLIASVSRTLNSAVLSLFFFSSFLFSSNLLQNKLSSQGYDSHISVLCLSGHYLTSTKHSSAKLLD